MEVVLSFLLPDDDIFFTFICIYNPELNTRHHLMTTTPPAHRSRRLVQSGLRLSILASCNGMVWVAVALGMPLTMFLEAIGASGFMLGLAMTAQQIAMGFQLPGGIIANRLRHLKPVWFSFALPHRLVWLAMPVLPFLFAENHRGGAVAVVVIVAVSAVLANLGTPAWFSWMSSLVPARESGSFWSIRQAWTMAAFLIATAASGWLLDVSGGGDGLWRYGGFVIVFGIAAVFGVADILIHFRVPPPENIEPQAGNPLVSIRNILRDKNFRMLTLAFGLWGISLGLSGPFAMVYLKRTFNVSYSQLAAMTITFSAGTIAAGFFWGRIMDTIGARTFGSIMLLAIPLFSLPWFLLSEKTYTIPWMGETPEAVVVYVVINFFSGAFFSGVTLCQINLLTTLASAESRTITLALHFTLVGLIGATGPAIGGNIMDWLTDVPIAIHLPRGITFSFFHVQTMLHIATAMAAAWIFHKTTPAVTDVPVRKLLGNPLRTLTIIQNLITVATPRNEKARARAIERLSFSRVDAALHSLESALNDPSVLVRRQAIRALGRTQAAEGIKLLENHYRNSGDAELFPAVATALGECGNEAVVTVLIDMLNGSHLTRIEAVRSLGRIGTEWVRHPLIHLLQHSEDPDTIEAIGSALARIASRQITANHKKDEQTRKLARENSDFAITELLKTLSDPSPAIQEATIAALGGIQSPAAIHVLLHRLQHDEGSLKPHIARALVKSRHQEGVSALIENLEGADADTQLESARSLGEANDPRASHALIEMLRTSDDARVISASSEALAHLREIAAIYDIIPRMKTASNPLLKRTLAVAAGNLLSESGSFYAFLIQEENLPGSQTSRCISQLSRHLRRLCIKHFPTGEMPLVDVLNALEIAIENTQWPEAANRLFEITIGIATLTYGLEHGDQRTVFIEKLIWHNEHLGICAWFLYMITNEWNNPAFGPPAQLDVLLGLFALTEHSATL